MNRLRRIVHPGLGFNSEALAWVCLVLAVGAVGLIFVIVRESGLATGLLAALVFVLGLVVGMVLFIDEDQ